MSTENVQIVSLDKLEKGKWHIRFDNGECCVLYFSEIKGLHLKKGSYISIEIYEKILKDIVGKRAKKRALYLLEKMDRTEQQLREKLLVSEYPSQCIEDAIDYVKSFHYLDDERYAETFIRYKKEKMSRQQIRQKLRQKGVSREIIENAIEEEYDVEERVHIRSLLEKKHFSHEQADDGEIRRVYSYLLRRGFRSDDILKEMKCVGTDW